MAEGVARVGRETQTPAARPLGAGRAWRGAEQTCMSVPPAVRQLASAARPDAVRRDRDMIAPLDAAEIDSEMKRRQPYSSQA